MSRSIALDLLLGKQGNGSASEASQAFTFSRRALFLTGAQTAIGGLLVTRMAWLAIAENERYKLLAESNRVNLTLVPPRRGWLVDRNGHPIAINRTDFRVDLIPDRVIDAERTIDQLARLLDLDADERARIARDLAAAAGYQPVQVAENLPWEKFAAISVRLPDLPGVAPARGFSRYYPDGAAVGHLVGYVGAASARQYEESKDPLLITPGFKVGKDGLERTLEDRLRGQPGARRSEVTARGKLVRELTARADVPGETVKLTIDAGLQDYTARRLGLESGAAVVIDARSGGILAMASMPAYDPNSFSDGIGRREWAMLRDDDHIPLLNKTLQALYPPGSTLKPMAALAALADGVDPEAHVFCPGGYRLGNRFFRCLGRHGPVTMRRAIAKSCNTYFYTIGHRIGYDKIAAVARQFGLGQQFDLPVASQRYGTIPDSAWKQRKYKQQWSASDTLNATIGQGYVIVNPLQLAVMASRLASGRALAPRLLADTPSAGAALPFPAEHFAIVRQAMSQVVNGDGTAGRSRLPLADVRLAGKTGTAQVRKIAGAQRGGVGVPWKYRDHGLFVFFVPDDNPVYAGAVVIDHGVGGSRAAAPVASDMMLYLYDRAAAMAKLETLEAGWGGDLKTRTAAKATAIASPEPPPPTPSSPAAPAPVPSPTPDAAVTATAPTPAPADDPE